MRSRLTGAARALFAALLMTVLLAGCFSLPRENLEIIRYTLRPDSLGTPADSSYAHSLAIFPFEANATQRGDRMLYRVDDEEMGTYYYHRWIAPPEEEITDVLTEDMVESGLFEYGVYRQALGTTPSMELHGRLVHLYADNRDNREGAVLELVVTLFRLSPPLFEKKIALQRTYTYNIARGDSRVRSFVPGVATAMDQWLADVRADIIEQIQTLPPAEPPTAEELERAEEAKLLNTSAEQSLDQLKDNLDDLTGDEENGADEGPGSEEVGSR